MKHFFIRRLSERGLGGPCGMFCRQYGVSDPSSDHLGATADLFRCSRSAVSFALSCPRRVHEHGMESIPQVLDDGFIITSGCGSAQCDTPLPLTPRPMGREDDLWPMGDLPRTDRDYSELLGPIPMDPKGQSIRSASDALNTRAGEPRSGTFGMPACLLAIGD